MKSTMFELSLVHGKYNVSINSISLTVEQNEFTSGMLGFMS